MRADNSTGSSWCLVGQLTSVVATLADIHCATPTPHAFSGFLHAGHSSLSGQLQTQECLVFPCGNASIQESSDGKPETGNRALATAMSGDFPNPNWANHRIAVNRQPAILQGGEWIASVDRATTPSPRWSTALTRRRPTPRIASSSDGNDHAAPASTSRSS